MDLRLYRSDGNEDGRRPQLAVATGGFAKVTGLVFDMGDVLIDCTVWRRWLLQLVQRMGLQAGYRSFFSIWDRDFLDAVHRGERRYDEAFVAFLRQSGFDAAQTDEIIQASKLRKRQIEADTRPLPGVRSTLVRLHALGLQMAVLSDSEATGDAVRGRLDQLGLGAYFTAVVSSFDLRRTKPDRECYLEAARRLALRPEQVGFVGHDADELLGARRAGMYAIAVNYEHDASAEFFLARFDELLSLFESKAVATAQFRGAA